MELYAISGGNHSVMTLKNGEDKGNRKGKRVLRKMKYRCQHVKDRKRYGKMLGNKKSGFGLGKTCPNPDFCR